MIINLSKHLKLELPDDKKYTLYVYVGYLLQPVLIDVCWDQIIHEFVTRPVTDERIYKIVEELKNDCTE